MSDPTSEFFEMLRRRGPSALPKKFQFGSIRFDLDHGVETDHWFVAVDRGEVVVTREERPASCIARTDKAVFDQIVLGRVQMAAAVFRNDITVEGSVPFLLLFRRAFPPAPDARDPRELARQGRRQ